VTVTVEQADRHLTTTWLWAGRFPSGSIGLFEALVRLGCSIIGGSSRNVGLLKPHRRIHLGCEVGGALRRHSQYR